MDYDRVKNHGQFPRPPYFDIGDANKENRPPLSGEQSIQSVVPFTTTSRKPALITRPGNVPHTTAPQTSTNNTDSSKPKQKRTNTIRVSRRNERERNRVRLINLGFERLRAVVPCQSGEQLSKICTLRKAIWYIEHLDRVLNGQSSSSSNSSRIRSTGANVSASSTGTNYELGRRVTAIGTSRLVPNITGPEQSTRQPLRMRQQQQHKISTPPPPPPPPPATTRATTVIASPTPQFPSQQSQHSMKRTIGDEESRTETHGAVRMASWSYPDTPTGPYGILGSGGRSVHQWVTPTTMSLLAASTPSVSQSKQQVLSPIFPVHWASNCMEKASTPVIKWNDNEWVDGDSGYTSLDLTRSQIVQHPFRTTVDGTTSMKFSQINHHPDRTTLPDGVAPICSPGPSSFSAVTSTFPFGTWFGHTGT
ncbi:Achaete-scute transcription factor [Fasciola hepatica]|uniref:Achaete-scute transcription factor n=1 Tax=Fasciola hepatica TaxID=6192 RepID=A0A4E0S2P6_FASHE|nr:Achaete-scute transcription factor [Fasciola hepatica]